jgi:hypothetical protein
MHEYKHYVYTYIYIHIHKYLHIYMCIATNVVAGSNEQYVIKCQADEGYFSIFIRGAYTQPVPYDCGPRYVNTDVYVYMCIHTYI